MNIVVTGATSFLGAALCKELVSRGHQVYAVVRPGSSNRQALAELEKDSYFHIISRNLDELDQLDREISMECPVYFHFGWDGSGSENRKNPEVQGKNALDGMKALFVQRFPGGVRDLCRHHGGNQGVPSGLGIWQGEDRLWQKCCGKSAAVEPGGRVPDGVCPHSDLQRLRAGRPPVVVGKHLREPVFAGRRDGVWGLHPAVEFLIY